MKSDGIKRMKHLDGQFKGRNDLNLYYQCWLPVDEPKAILLVVHGLAEHSGRYSNLVNYFVPRGYGVYGYDQRGHGKSDGLRGYVERFSYFVDDLDIFLRLVHSRHRNVRVFLVGHSIGGTIATAYTIIHQDEFDGLILTGASLSTPTDVAAGTIFAARILSLILPKAGLYIINADAISQDNNVVNTYIYDPLVYRGKIRARLGVELIKAMVAVKHQISEIHLPILVMHGAADRLSDPKGSDMLYQKASSPDKTLKMYEGYYHEIFNEPGRKQVLADVESWLKSHV
ncbi:alpha/beta hydrolase [Chloroflexota bacterium]